MSSSSAAEASSTANVILQPATIGSFFVALCTVGCGIVLLRSPLRYKHFEMLQFSLPIASLLILTIIDTIYNSVVLTVIGWTRLPRESGIKSNFISLTGHQPAGAAETMMSDSTMLAGYTIQFLLALILQGSYAFAMSTRLTKVHHLFESDDYRAIFSGVLISEFMVLLAVLGAASPDPNLALDVLSMALLLQLLLSSVTQLFISYYARKALRMTLQHLARVDRQLLVTSIIASGFMLIGNLFLILSLVTPWSAQVDAKGEVQSVGEGLRFGARFMWLIAVTALLRMFVLRKWRHGPMDHASSMLSILLADDKKPKSGQGAIC